jgi:hypothetical protein
MSDVLGHGIGANVHRRRRRGETGEPGDPTSCSLGSAKTVNVSS